MKHTAAFILILALVLSVGYYSVNISGLFSGSSRLENTRLPRNVQDYGSAYISGEETGFHPMELVENASDYHSTQYDLQYNSSIKDICAALIAVISHYDTRAQLTPDVGKKLASDLNIKNSYVYVEKFQYINIRNQTRFLDCIITKDDFRIVYLRFYSDEEIQISTSVTEAALEEFDSQSRTLYYSVEKEAANIYDAAEKSNFYFEQSFDISSQYYTYDACYEALLPMYNFIYDYIGRDNPVNTFWLASSFFSLIGFNYYSGYEDYFYSSYFVITAVGHICDKMIYVEYISEPEYTTYQGRIYQSILFDHSELITIYNARDRYIEGFYAPVYN